MALLYLPEVVAHGFWFIVPLGLVSQLVMSRIGRGQSSPVDKPLRLMSLVSVSAAAAFVVYVRPQF